jgi:hypothetical protein
MENEETPTQEPTLEVNQTEQPGPTPEELRRQRQIVIGASIALVVFLALLIISVIFLLNPGTPTERIRDVFIIFMALESLVIGLVLIVLVVQLARLTNLLQNEIKPILDSTNETVSTLRGTATFMSDNLAEPVIKLNEYLAGLQKFITLIRPARSNHKDKTTE